MDEEHFAYVGEHFQVLLYTQKQIYSKTMVLKVKYMPPEEKKRWLLAEEARKGAIEEMEKKNEIMRLIK